MGVPRHLRRQQGARRRAEVEDRIGADAVAGVRFVEDDIHGRVGGPVDQLSALVGVPVHHGGHAGDELKDGRDGDGNVVPRAQHHQGLLFRRLAVLPFVFGDKDPKETVPSSQVGCAFTKSILRRRDLGFSGSLTISCLWTSAISTSLSWNSGRTSQGKTRTLRKNRRTLSRIHNVVIRLGRDPYARVAVSTNRIITSDAWSLVSCHAGRRKRSLLRRTQVGRKDLTASTMLSFFLQATEARINNVTGVCASGVRASSCRSRRPSSPPGSRRSSALRRAGGTSRSAALYSSLFTLTTSDHLKAPCFRCGAPGRQNPPRELLKLLA